MRAGREAAVFREDYFVDNDGKENINRFFGSVLIQKQEKAKVFCLFSPSPHSLFLRRLRAFSASGFFGT